MAKLNNPLHSLSAFGQVTKDLVIRRRDSLHILERKPRPVDRKSLAQLSWRTMYQKAIALWHALSEAEQQAWESAARPLHMTGYAWFMSQALKPNPGIYLPLAGGTMQGAIDMDSNKILNLPAPSADEEPARLTDIFLPTILQQANFIMLPSSAGWTEVVTGAGAVLQQPVRQLVLIADVNAGSALAYCVAFGFNIGGFHGYINWGKKLYLIFNYAIYKTEAALNRRVQIEAKSPVALGQLTGQGIGFQAIDLVMTGESYGTARGTVGLGNILPTNSYHQMMQVIIELDPGTATNFYINGSLAGSITNVNHIPSGISTVGARLKHSIDRAGGGAASVASVVFHGKIWQEL